MTKKPFVKWVFYGIELPLHQNFMHWPSPTAALEQSLGAIWDAASQAVALILAEIKLNLQLPSCTSFLVDSYCDHEGTQSGLSYFDCTPGGTGTLVPAVAPCAHPPPWGVEMNLSKSFLVLEFPILVEILNFIWQWSRLPAPPASWKILREGSWNMLGHIH